MYEEDFIIIFLQPSAPWKHHQNDPMLSSGLNYGNSSGNGEK